MDGNHRRINNLSECLYSSRICISTFHPTFLHFPSDGAVAEKIIYCIFAFFVCAVSSTDDSMSDYKSISKPTKRAFKFICSIKLNDEVDMKSG